MKFELDFSKSIEENASLCFEEAKKAKRKLAGLAQAIGQTKGEIAKAQKASKEKQEGPAKKMKRQWFHSFHWFFSSDGFLVLGGRNAKDNEQLVKKHLSPEDLFLHADIPGAAATIIKTNGRNMPEQTLTEAAQFAAVFSKAWKQHLPAVDVYAVKAEQVSKHAQSKEALQTGSFMIYGKRKWFRKTPLGIAMGLSKDDNSLISGPLAAIQKNASYFIEIIQGKESASDSAKKILSMLQKHSPTASAITLDEIIRMIPSEGLELREGT